MQEGEAVCNITVTLCQMGFAHQNAQPFLPAPAGGHSHARDVGRILFWKRTRPTPRKKSTRAFRFALDPQRHKGRGPRPPPLETTPKG